MRTLAGALKDYLRTVELEGKARRTIQTYEYHLGKFADWLEDVHGALVLEEIDTSHVQGFLLHLKSRPKRPGNGYRTKPTGNLSQASIRLVYNVLCGFFSWAQGMGYINGRHPVRTIKMKRTNGRAPRPPSEEEIRKFCQMLQGPNLRKARLRYLIEFLWGSGLRLSEALSLRVKDTDLNARRIAVARKGGEEVTIAISKPAAKALAEYLETVRPGVDKGISDHLFLGDTGKAWSPNGAQKSFRAYSGKNGIKLHAHALRHAWATKAADGGMPLFMLMRLGGWQRPSTCQRYYHGTLDNAQKELDRIFF